MKIDFIPKFIQITATLSTTGKPSRAAIEVTSAVRTSDGSSVDPKQVKVSRVLTTNESELLTLLLRSSEKEKEA